MNDSTSVIDTKAAQAYERYLVAALMQPVAAQGLDAAALRPGESLLDVACGTGVVGRLAARRLSPAGRIAGLDIDPAMIKTARSLAQPDERVSFDWHCAGADCMPFESSTFDVVTCVQGLQYMPDSAAVLSEVRRVLKENGRFVAVVWTTLERCAGQHAIAEALKRRNIDIAAILKAYSLGDPQRIRKLARDSGFSAIDTRISSSTAKYPSARDFVEAFAAGSVSSSAAIGKVPAERREEFMSEIGQALRPHEVGAGVTLPLEFLILSAVK